MNIKYSRAAKVAKKIMEEVFIETLAERCEVYGGPNPEAKIKFHSLRDLIWDKNRSLKVEQIITAIINQEIIIKQTRLDKK